MPPHTPFCNSEVFANIESTTTCDLSFEGLTSVCSAPADMGMADVDNCFHIIRIDESLGKFFCLPTTFSAKEPGIVGEAHGGIVLGPDTRVRALS